MGTWPSRPHALMPPRPSSQVAVPQHPMALAREARSELLGAVDRAAAPAGAADGHRDGGALVQQEARQPARQELRDVLDEEVGLRLAREEVLHRRVVAG